MKRTTLGALLVLLAGLGYVLYWETLNARFKQAVYGDL